MVMSLDDSCVEILAIGAFGLKQCRNTRLLFAE